LSIFEKQLLVSVTILLLFVISGIFQNGRAIVDIIFRLPNQPDFTIEFVIDTGFTEFLSLPPAAVTLLGFPFVYDMYAN
jgi:predicted aspartyl protease